MTDVIKALLAKGEGVRTEFKSRVPQREILGKVVCSFANANGGTLVIGVGDKGEVIGVNEASIVAEALSKDAAKILSPAISISTSVAEIEGKNLVLVDVPAGPDRPYTFGRKIYVRKGERSELADVERLRELLTDMPRFEIRWERRPAGDVAESDLDVTEIEKVVSSAQRLFGYSFPSDAQKIERLEVLNLALHGQLHNGAVVVFGRYPQRRFPQTRVRAIRFADEAQREMQDNKVFEGHAFKLVDAAEQFILSHVPVTGRITDVSLERGDQSRLPRTAIREALLNAVQHRDYESYDGSIIIKIMPAKVSIWNPGSLPEGLTIKELKGVHYSRPRNPDIAHAFFLRGLVERVGSGTSRILSALREAGLPDAEWRTVSGGLEIVFGRGRPSTENNERQQALLTHLEPGKSITLSDYIRRFAQSVSERQARADLSQLAKRGLLTKRGSARSTRYERTESETT